MQGYGPQEDDDINHILNFWQEVEAETIKAKDEDCHIIIQMDANAKIGSENIKGDPHKMSNNGKIMLDIMKRQSLTIVNTLNVCKGTITRERITEGKSEKSAIDYIIISEGLLEYLLEMVIDEEKVYGLARFMKNSSGNRVIYSDHNTLYSKFLISIDRKRKELRKEFFKFKCEIGKNMFLNETNTTSKLTSCFNSSDCLDKRAHKFHKALNGIFHKCFKKVRVTSGNTYKLGTNSIQSKLELKTRLKLSSKSNHKAKHTQAEISSVDKEIIEEISARNAEIVKEHVSNLDTLEGTFSQTGLWKLKKKLCPTATDPPMAKRDEKGNLITSPLALKQLYLDTYTKRLAHRDMKTEYMDIYFLKSELWKSRLENLKNTRSQKWSMDNLDDALKNLKNNKTLDPNGMINETFKKGYIGSDLKKALLTMYNDIKKEHTIPDFMTLQNITTIYKNKGSRMDMEMDRGIFILTVMKKILDRLLYKDYYQDVDNNMSDCNIGSRKKRNIKDHLLIIHGVINSVIKGKEDPVDIQIYDLEKAFDALWLEDCLNDIFDNIPTEKQNDKLSLLYEANKTNKVAIKTSVGITNRVNMPTIVQQGGTWGSLLCSNSIDTFGKKCRDGKKNIYLYKNTAKILPLAFVDDLNGISKCGAESIDLNIFMNTQIELKKLKFHTNDKKGNSKCHKMHIGKSVGKCPTLKVHGTIMQEVTEDRYLGDIISSDGKNTKNIKDRISKGIGIISNIINILDTVCFGPFYFEIAMLLRNSVLINGTLTNAEIWYNFSPTEVKEFERLDILYLTKIFEVPRTTPHEAFYLELGIIPIEAILKGRRANYLHSILSRQKSSSMLYNFFITQWLNPTKGDWTLQVQQDLEDLGIPQSFNYIASKSAQSFKKLVKSKVEQFSFNILKKKQNTHSKMKNLNYDKLEMQDYLSCKHINISEKKTIFRYRTRMENFGENFRGGKTTAPCPLCHLHTDQQDISFQCTEIKKYIDVKGNISDIYKDTIDYEAMRTAIEISKYRKTRLQT